MLARVSTLVLPSMCKLVQTSALHTHTTVPIISEKKGHVVTFGLKKNKTSLVVWYHLVDLVKTFINGSNRRTFSFTNWVLAAVFWFCWVLLLIPELPYSWRWTEAGAAPQASCVQAEET